MSDAPILSLAGVGKRYATYSSSLARAASWFGLPVEPSSVFWANRDISFDVMRGQAVALIGANGAGKSTLLKMITGTVRPTVGRITVSGRISAILELGIGFNPELSGRNNVQQAGGLMGFTQAEITALMPEIEAFAELDEFFDQPLRTYSSGMQARLAFSLATAKQPDLLIVDEVLSVGDTYFSHKSYDRIREFKERGSSIFLVTHGMGDVRALCDRVLLLDKGTVLKDGPPDEVVDYYNAMVAIRDNARMSVEQRRQRGGWLHTRSGTFSAVVEAIDLLDETGSTVATALVDQKLCVRASVAASTDIEKLVLGLMVRDRTGHVVWGTNTWHTRQVLENVIAGDRFVFSFHFDCKFGPGSYSISTALSASDVHLDSNYEWQDNVLIFDVISGRSIFFIGTTAVDGFFEVQKEV